MQPHVGAGLHPWRQRLQRRVIPAGQAFGIVDDQENLRAFPVPLRSISLIESVSRGIRGRKHLGQLLHPLLDGFRCDAKRCTYAGFSTSGQLAAGIDEPNLRGCAAQPAPVEHQPRPGRTPGPLRASAWPAL